jgi:hypothetical protein
MATVKEATIILVSELTSKFFFSVAQSCVQQMDASQRIIVSCGRDVATIPEESEATLACLDQVRLQARQRLELERRVWTTPEKAAMRYDAKRHYDDVIAGLEGCRFSAKNCLLEGSSQLSVISLEQTCVLSSEALQSWRRSVSGELSQQMYKRRDLLGAIANATGQGNNQHEALVNIRNSVTQIVDQSVADAILNAIRSSQTIEVTSRGGASVLVSGVHQSSAMTAATQSLIKRGLGADLMSEEKWKIAQETWRSNTTLTSAGDLLVGALYGFTDSVLNIVDAMLYSAAILLIAALLYVAYSSLSGSLSS